MDALQDTISKGTKVYKCGKNYSINTRLNLKNKFV